MIHTLARCTLLLAATAAPLVAQDAAPKPSPENRDAHRPGGDRRPGGHDLFAQLDANHDGVIDRVEFQEGAPFRDQGRRHRQGDVSPRPEGRRHDGPRPDFQRPMPGRDGRRPENAPGPRPEGFHDQRGPGPEARGPERAANDRPNPPREGAGQPEARREGMNPPRPDMRGPSPERRGDFARGPVRDDRNGGPDRGPRDFHPRGAERTLRHDLAGPRPNAERPMDRPMDRPMERPQGAHENRGDERKPGGHDGRDQREMHRRGDQPHPEQSRPAPPRDPRGDERRPEPAPASPGVQ